jgi:hypothetical protein
MEPTTKGGRPSNSSLKPVAIYAAAPTIATNNTTARLVDLGHNVERWLDVQLALTRTSSKGLDRANRANRRSPRSQEPAVESEAERTGSGS